MAPLKRPDQPTIPTFNAEAIRSHVEMLHGLAKGQNGVLVTTVFFANLTGDKDSQGAVTHHRIGDVDGMCAAIMAHDGVPNANVYVVPAVMRRDLPRGRKGTEADVVAVLALVADQDDDTGMTGEMPVDIGYSVESSPGNFQKWVIFDQPLPPAEAKRLAQAFKRATGSDHCSSDISHTWRVPGCLNWPNRKKLDRGRAPTPAPVMVSEPWEGIFTSSEELAAALQPWKQAPISAVSVSIGALPIVERIEVTPNLADLLAADNVGDRSAHAARIVEKLAFDGHDLEPAAALFLAATGNWTARYRGADHMRTDFERLWSKPIAQQHIDMRAEGVRLSAGIVGKAKVKPQPANDNNVGAARPDQQPIDAETLLGMEFPPVDYVVQDYVAEGLTILAGRPKLGKSWMALGFCVAVATGGTTLGVECEEGDVLYLALEDNRRRLKDRLNVVLSPPRVRPKMSRLTLQTKSTKIGAGLVEELDAWRKSVTDPKLIIIDTLSMVRPPKKANQDSYAADYDAISPLQQYASEHRIAVVVVHHVRKAEADDPLEAVSGTNGLTGAADTILVLTRTTDGPKIYGRGRDIEEIEKALRFDQGVWTVLGNADEVKQSDQRRKITSVLTDATHALTPSEIASEVEMKESNVKYLLRAMVKAGTAEKVGYGQYKLPGR